MVVFMNGILLLEDSNSVAGFVNSIIYSTIGGDWLLFGICVMVVVCIALIFAKAKTGLAVAAGMSFIFFISLLNPVFWFAWWLAILVAAFILINALRKQITGG